MLGSLQLVAIALGGTALLRQGRELGELRRDLSEQRIRTEAALAARAPATEPRAATGVVRPPADARDAPPTDNAPRRWMTHDGSDHPVPDEIREPEATEIPGLKQATIDDLRQNGATAAALDKLRDRIGAWKAWSERSGVAEDKRDLFLSLLAKHETKLLKSAAPGRGDDALYEATAASVSKLIGPDVAARLESNDPRFHGMPSGGH